jgi:predicted ribosome quality control (RQC) complex YloA/Tae2 family protein
VFLKEGETSAKSFLLVSQNRSLNRELQRNKRTIAEARKELELMRRKSREMESLVSLIQRAWSQV